MRDPSGLFAIPTGPIIRTSSWTGRLRPPDPPFMPPSDLRITPPRTPYSQRLRARNDTSFRQVYTDPTTEDEKDKEWEEENADDILESATDYRAPKKSFRASTCARRTARFYRSTNSLKHEHSIPRHRIPPISSSLKATPDTTMDHLQHVYSTLVAKAKEDVERDFVAKLEEERELKSNAEAEVCLIGTAGSSSFS